MSTARGAKRLLDSWEPPVFKDLIGNELEINVVPDVVSPGESLLLLTERVLKRLDGVMTAWPTQPDVQMKQALGVVALHLEDRVLWASHSNLVLANILGVVLNGQCVAHSDGVYQYTNGFWDRVDEFSGATLREVEMAVNSAALVFRLCAKQNLGRNWDTVFNYLKDHHAEVEEHSHLSLYDFRVSREEERAMWALGAGKVMGT